MKPDPAENPLREKLWRGALSDADQARLRAWLAQHPEAQADADAEQGLNQLLSRLPDAPVPSNFTARVWQAIEQENRTAMRLRHGLPWWLRVFVPRAAAVAVVLTVTLVGYNGYQSHQRTQRMVTELTPVAEVKTVPSVDVLEDFDVIHRLQPAAVVDQGLLSLQDDLRSLTP